LGPVGLCSLRCVLSAECRRAHPALQRVSRMAAGCPKLERACIIMPPRSLIIGPRLSSSTRLRRSFEESHARKRCWRGGGMGAASRSSSCRDARGQRGAPVRQGSFTQRRYRAARRAGYYLRPWLGILFTRIGLFCETILKAGGSRLENPPEPDPCFSPSVAGWRLPRPTCFRGDGACSG
jgi:hypothetical protein